MTRIIMVGCGGKMGQVISGIVEADEDAQIVAGVDIAKAECGYPVYPSIAEVKEEADAIIDFSHPSLLDGILAYAVEKQVPAVLCTTGYSNEDIEKINQAAEKVALLRSANMSLGINTMMKVLETVTKTLADAGFDIEIVEKHHNQKLDAPSGTALMLADAVSEALPYDAEYVYDRHERRMKRPQNEIGIHSVRGGTIVGEHEVLFAGRDELIEIRHVALSREVFAVGAVDAAAFLGTQKQPGMYDMSDVIAAK